MEKAGVVGKPFVESRSEVAPELGHFRMAHYSPEAYLRATMGALLNGLAVFRVDPAVVTE